jgi:hypothetical protein
MKSPAAKLTVSAADRLTLVRWVRSPLTAQRLVLRSRIILALAEGHSLRIAAKRVGTSRHTVALWRSRFRDDGCESLRRDKPGRGRKPAAAPDAKSPPAQKRR